MSEWITALADSAALLLVASGWTKLRRPGGTATAIAALTRRPAVRDGVGRGAARAVGLAELCVAGLVLAAGGRPAAGLLAALYLGFLVVAARLRSVAAGTSCGCFGAASAPVGRAHLVVCACAVATAGAGLVVPPAGVAEVVRAAPGTGPVLVALVVVLAALAYLCLTSLPALRVGTAPKGAST